MALGTRPSVSPLVMKGHVASRETEAEAKWGAEPIIFAVPTVGAGCSGGPVFLSLENHDRVVVVGMYVGMMFDNSGVKLSKIIPTRVIREAVKLTSTIGDAENAVP